MNYAVFVITLLHNRFQRVPTAGTVGTAFSSICTSVHFSDE